MDYQNRVGNKQGGGGLASNEEINLSRKNRIKELLSTTNNNFLKNDPYVFKNHLGFLECKLCLTSHVSESSYLIHIKGKKHQANLQKRQNKLNKNLNSNDNTINQNGITSIAKRNYTKIGIPGYKIKKIRHEVTEQIGLLIIVSFPEISKEIKKPIYRFMNYFEQKIEKLENENENKYQYLIISGEPYENIAIKIPNSSINRNVDTNGNEMLWDYWDEDIKTYYLQFFFES